MLDNLLLATEPEIIYPKASASIKENLVYGNMLYADSVYNICSEISKEMVETVSFSHSC